MSKMILEFDMEDGYERVSALKAANADKAFIAIDDMFNVLRQGWKYGNIDGKELSAKEIELCDTFREKFSQICVELGIGEL